jgi:hypothetical protein
MKHKLSEINEETRTAICSVCGPTKIKLRDAKLPITNRYKCHVVYRRFRYPNSVHRKDYCEHCDFKPVHISQLDVDHIDGNRNNNDPSNLQTLCANCHRLKTYLNGDSYSVNAKEAPTQDFS